MPFLMRKLLGYHLRAEGDEGGDGGSGADPADAHGREQELEASRKGWMPKHKYKGPEGGWKDAATFLADGNKYNNRLQDELANVKKQLADFQGTAKQFAEFQQKQIEQRDSQIGDLVKDLQKQHREAIRTGNDEDADAIEDRIELLRDERGNIKKQIEAAKQPTPKFDPHAVVDENGNTNNPEVRAWIDNGNQWFNESKPMRDYAFALSTEMMEGGETARGKAFLEKLGAHMQEAFPKYFEKRGDPTSRGNMTDSGSRSSASGDPTEHDLPPEDLEIMRLGIKQGWTTKTTFLKNYFSDEPRRYSSPDKKK